MIDNTLHVEEVSPFLNELANDSDNFYFDIFYHQTAQEKISDSGFITENFLYPLYGGAVFFTHAKNSYHSMPEILKKNDYGSYVLLANVDTFWNRNQMYKSLNITDFYDKSSFDIEEDNEIGWGLKDKEFFRQAVPYMEELMGSFHAKMIAITNYFPTVHCTDEAIEQFFDQLKVSGLYEDSIIVIMGDHDGISVNHNKAMTDYMGQEIIDDYVHQQLQRIHFLFTYQEWVEEKENQK